LTLHVAPLEAFWLSINVAGVLLTLIALYDARSDVAAARLDKSERHEARQAVAEGNVRREALRTVIHLLLLSIVLPGLFVDRPIMLTPPLVALCAVPVVLLIQSALDWRERRQISDRLLALVRADQELALEASVQKNIALTEDAGRKAEAAFDAANHSNERLDALARLVNGKADKPTDG
jgi:hypothetical protein